MRFFFYFVSKTVQQNYHVPHSSSESFFFFVEELALARTEEEVLFRDDLDLAGGVERTVGVYLLSDRVVLKKSSSSSFCVWPE